MRSQSVTALWWTRNFSDCEVCFCVFTVLWWLWSLYYEVFQSMFVRAFANMAGTQAHTAGTVFWIAISYSPLTIDNWHEIWKKSIARSAMLTLRVFLLLRKYLCLLLYNQKKSFAVTCYVFDDTFFLLIIQRALSNCEKKLRNMMKGLILFFSC